MNIRSLVFIATVSGGLAACAGAQVTRTSANTMIIDAAAAPACGSLGAAKVASKAAAIETIKAGFERYIILGGSSANNVTVTQGPGTIQTSGNMTYGRGYGTYNSTSTYMPGAPMYSGTHDRSLTVVMFKKGDAGYNDALDAKTTLGPEWADVVKSGVSTCL